LAQVHKEARREFRLDELRARSVKRTPACHQASAAGQPSDGRIAAGKARRSSCHGHSPGDSGDGPPPRTTGGSLSTMGRRSDRPNFHLIQGGRPKPEPDASLEVMIHVRSRREPYGRAGPHRLSERGLKELAAAASRIERACR
jgi:hypothetical protein